MALLINDKVVFVHVPKTGGTAIRNALYGRYKLRNMMPPGLKDVRSPEKSWLSHHSNGRWLSFPKLCVVREPVSWVLSAWRYWKSKPYEITRVAALSEAVSNTTTANNWSTAFWGKALSEAFDPESFEGTLTALLVSNPGIASKTMASFADQEDMTVVVFPDFRKVSHWLQRHVPETRAPDKFGHDNVSKAQPQKASRSVLEAFVDAESSFYDKYGVDPHEAVEKHVLEE